MRAVRVKKRETSKLCKIRVHYRDVNVGDVINAKYRLLATIGRGGMGEVFRAIDLGSNEHVAIKVVGRSSLGDVLLARLQREASAAAQITSDYIPRVIETGEAEDGEFFMVMDLLVGESLSERMKRVGGVIPWSDVHRIGEHVLMALIDAHSAGVVHRDLKPGNVFLVQNPDRSTGAKILDFGVCKFDEADAEKLTVTGELVGTIAYMAPEQIRGASRVDGRADLYSFSMVVFEMMSGRLPFDAQGQMALLASKLEKAPRRLSEVVEGPIPGGLEDLLALGLARDPDLRPRDAAEMLTFWRSLVSRASGQMRTLGVPAVNNTTQTAISSNAPVVQEAPKPKQTLAAVAFGVSVAFAAVVLGLIVRNSSVSRNSENASDDTVNASTAQVGEPAAARYERERIRALNSAAVPEDPIVILPQPSASARQPAPARTTEVRPAGPKEPSVSKPAYGKEIKPAVTEKPAEKPAVKQQEPVVKKPAVSTPPASTKSTLNKSGILEKPRY